LPITKTSSDTTQSFRFNLGTTFWCHLIFLLDI
jgi:hypothetical protein